MFDLITNLQTFLKFALATKTISDVDTDAGISLA